jgi:Tfp pilus assembly protein PilO
MNLEKLQAMPWYKQVAIFGGVALLIYGCLWYFVFSGMREETQTIQAQVDKLRQENAQAQIASQRINEFRAAYKSRQEEYDELKALLPEQREITSVLQGLQDRARGSRLSLRRFAPKDDVQEDFYSNKPVEVEVTSTFGSLRDFFDQMAHYQRIVSITDFKISQTLQQSSSQSIDAQFTLKAYYASPEKLQNAMAANNGAANAGTAPAAKPAK